jgi:signal transduction protein with GAF and PtsI domain
LINDVSTNPRLAKSRAKVEKFRSFAAVPIMSREKILGVMGVASHRHREFPEWEVKNAERYR